MACLHAAAVVLALICLTISVHGHGGTFHEYPSTPEGGNSIRYKVGTCKPWVPINATGAPPNAELPYDIVGPTTLWAYRYKNCSDSLSACVELKLNFTQNDKPVVGLNVTGYAHVDACATGGGAKYKLDLTVPDTEANSTYVWIKKATTNYTGSFWGQGANDGPLVTTEAGNGVSSYILYITETQEPFACCDFQFNGPRTSNWTTLLEPGVKCEEDAHGHGGHSDKGSNATAPAAQNSTGTGAQNKAAFGAGLAMGSWQAAVAVAAVGLALLQPSW